MHKEYDKLKDLPDEKKAKESEKLANDMANTLKETNGIDEEIKITVVFTDQPKEDELGAYVREDAKQTKEIKIFINVKDVDVSDMEQVYNALGYEMNHYNPSNPYVYDMTEQQAGRNNKLEEDFTSIGRKQLDGSGNSFYENILNGSNTLESGNIKYGNYSYDDLDFRADDHGLQKAEEKYNKCQSFDCFQKMGQIINNIKNDLKLTGNDANQKIVVVKQNYNRSRQYNYRLYLVI